MVLFGIGIFLIIAGVSFDFAINLPRLKRLRDVEPKTENFPSLSILIPVRNEEKHLENALTSVLSLDYPDVEIVVLDDRSTDSTPEILARMVKRHPKLQTRRIDTLPPGWLGKNHALFEGFRQSRGEFILFTDADVVFQPDTLKRAMAYLERERADFLTVFPQMLFSTLGTKFFAAAFVVLFHSNTRPWAVANPKSKAGVGIGAFGLIRRKGYEKLGTHAAFPLFPDDDLELGRRAKRSGLACRILDGQPLVCFPWYPTVWESVKGFEKNFFAGLEFKVSHTLFACLALFVLHLWPLIGLFIPGNHQPFYAAIVALDLALFSLTCRYFGVPAWHGFGYPFGVAAFLFTALRSMKITLQNGGIRWRDTHYPLDALRAARRSRH